MEAELKSLQIDRSKRRSGEPRSGPRAGLSWALLFLLAGRVAIALRKLNAAPVVEIAARACGQRCQRARGRGAQRDRIHCGRPQDRSGGQGGRQGELDRRGQGRPCEAKARCWCAWRTTNIRRNCEQARGQSGQPAGQAGRGAARSRPEEIAQAQANLNPPRPIWKTPK